MFDSVCQFLEKIGYPHPIHPSKTHIPIGLLVGAFFFAWVAFLFRRLGLARTARHCIFSEDDPSARMWRCLVGWSFGLPGGSRRFGGIDAVPIF